MMESLFPNMGQESHGCHVDEAVPDDQLVDSDLLLSQDHPDGPGVGGKGGGKDEHVGDGILRRDSVHSLPGVDCQS